MVGGALRERSLRLLGFRLGRFDLGNMVQAVWSTAHGRPLDYTRIDGQQTARLASHVDPILVLLAPLWAVVPSPLTLAAVQIVAVALGALPVYWLGRRHLGSERLAALLALAYLAYPWLSWNAVDAMHPATLAVPLFLYCVYFLDGDRLWAAAPFAVLALATGELMGISLAALGVWYGLARRRRWAGARHRRCSAWDGRSSRSMSSSRRSPTARAPTSGTTPRSAALR